jgi:AraC-like DNA-binding protein
MIDDGSQREGSVPSSAFRTFTEPDEYAAAIVGAAHRFTITQRGTFSANLTFVDLHQLWMQRLSDNLPRVDNCDISAERAIIAFRAPSAVSLVHNGVQQAENHITRLGPGRTYSQRSAGPAVYCGMSLPIDEMDTWVATTLGRDLPPTYDVTIKATSDAMARLQRLHAAAGALAEDAPGVLADSDAARGLKHALIEAMMGCLDGGDVHEDKTAQRQHAAIMRKFHRVVEQHADDPLYIPELCKEIGTSLRTLNACCREHLGMGPKHYLVLRRMHMLRRALRLSNPGETTVTEIATRYGFWQFGRLAVEYRALFGEVPSATLAQPV